MSVKVIMIINRDISEPKKDKNLSIQWNVLTYRKSPMALKNQDMVGGNLHLLQLALCGSYLFRPQYPNDLNVNFRIALKNN